MPRLPDPARLGLSPSAIIAVPSEGETLYRLTGRERPRPTDFRSNRDKGRAATPRESAILHCGISMFDSEEAARSRARRTPMFLAVVTLEPGADSLWPRPLARATTPSGASPRVSQRVLERSRPADLPSVEIPVAYELLWTDHADVVGTYGSRSEAEADLRAYATEHPKHANEIALIEIDGQGRRVGDFVSGAEILRRQPA